VELVGSEEGAQLLTRWKAADLAHEDAFSSVDQGRFVADRSPAAVELVKLGLSPGQPVLRFGEALVGARIGDVAHALVLEECRRGVDAKPVDVAREPEPEHVLERSNGRPDCANSSPAGDA
jgi:hypothetical protein